MHSLGSGRSSQHRCLGGAARAAMSQWSPVPPPWPGLGWARPGIPGHPQGRQGRLGHPVGLFCGRAGTAPPGRAAASRGHNDSGHGSRIGAGLRPPRWRRGRGWGPRLPRCSLSCIFSGASPGPHWPGGPKAEGRCKGAASPREQKLLGEEDWSPDLEEDWAGAKQLEARREERWHRGVPPPPASVLRETAASSDGMARDAAAGPQMRGRGYLPTETPRASVPWPGVGSLALLLFLHQGTEQAPAPGDGRGASMGVPSPLRGKEPAGLPCPTFGGLWPGRGCL